MRMTSIVAFGFGLVVFSCSALADKRSDCSRYTSLATDSVHQNQNQKCRYTGGRWSTEKSHHMNWCMNLADPDWHFVRDETMARLAELKACTAKSGEWDMKSPHSSGVGFGTYSPGPVGEKACNDQGKIIMDAVAKVSADPSMFADNDKDSGFYFTRYYNLFNHWKGYRCKNHVRSIGGVKTREVRLEGYTRGPVGITEKPRPGQILVKP